MDGTEGLFFSLMIYLYEFYKAGKGFAPFLNYTWQQFRKTNVRLLDWEGHQTGNGWLVRRVRDAVKNVLADFVC